MNTFKKRCRFRRAKTVKVVPYPNPMLKMQSEDVDPKNESDFKKLIDDMAKTMYKEEGVGLAAIQVGIAKNFFVYDDSAEQNNPRVLCNPVILSHSEETEESDEGCLSFPGIFFPVERPVAVVVEGLDEEGEPLHLEVEGFTARLLQHEMDHLKGIVILDRATPHVRKQVIREHYMGK